MRELGFSKNNCTHSLYKWHCANIFLDCLYIFLKIIALKKEKRKVEIIFTLSLSFCYQLFIAHTNAHYYITLYRSRTFTLPLVSFYYATALLLSFIINVQSLLIIEHNLPIFPIPFFFESSRERSLKNYSKINIYNIYKETVFNKHFLCYKFYICWSCVLYVFYRTQEFL